MQGRDRPVSRWLHVGILGLAGALLLACIIPSLSRNEPTAFPTFTPRPLPSPTAGTGLTPMPGAVSVVTEIGEEQMSAWLQSARPDLGEGVSFEAAGVQIQSSGITISGQVRVEQMRDLEMPVEILLKPVVRDGHLDVEVLDVQLGGAGSPFGSLVKPLVSAGIGEGLNVERLLAEQGVRVTSVELKEGSMVVTAEAAGQAE